MIEVQGVNKTFGDRQVLFDINTVFEPGKCNLIIGASGSGKTTLTKCMVGLHEPESGQILFEGRDFLTMTFKEKKELRKELGFLFQGGALFDSLTVEENVRFPLEMFTNQSKQDMQKRVDFCLERVQLSHAHKLYPAELSGGMKKRVGIARAISMNPKFLFCDEPNSGLDPQTSIVIDKLISELTHEFGMTTVVITHDMNSVLEIGENLNFIYQGKLWWKGDRHQILNTNNKEVVDFVYASDFMQSIREKSV